MVEIYIIISLTIGIGLGYYLANQTNQSNDEELEGIKKEMEKAFKSVAFDVNKSNTEEFLKIADDKFQNLSKEADKDLENKKKLIDGNLETMSKKLQSIEQHSIKLNQSLEDSNSQTKDLRETTSKLREILSSSQKRGQWGERIVEDILNVIGFIEGINYTKQEVIDSGERPDFTFNLPKGKHLNMDVKFPLAHYEKYVDTEDELVRSSEKNSFLKDVKKHVKDITKRSYIDPSSGTVDYVLMLVPNESIFSFINKEDSDVIDYALENKVLLCSPLTLYAVLSLINQAISNFAMEKKATEVMNLLNNFKMQWEKYIEVMDKMGRSLDTAKKDYDTMVSTRRRQLEKPLDKIEEITSLVESSEADKLGSGQQKF
jgi:DNA recombination protein RmuC